MNTSTATPPPSATVAAENHAVTAELPAPVQEHMDTLAGLVLDAAELANRGAQSSVHAGNEFRGAVEQLRKFQSLGHRQARWLLISASLAMGLALVFFLIVGIRVGQRVEQLDTVLKRVAEKADELQTGVAAIEQMQQTVHSLSERVDVVVARHAALDQQSTEWLKQSEGNRQQWPTQMQQQINGNHAALIKQVQGVDRRLQTQLSSVQEMGKEVAALKQSLSQVDRLNKEVKALVTLQKEQYLEQMKKNQLATQELSKPPALQYPRPDGAR